MTTTGEREYRRLLRLLPVGYRARWEDEMVGAYLDRADAAGPLPASERLSIVALALRLRLDGSHATARGRVWYRALHALALLVLLYQALAATIKVAGMVRNLIEHSLTGADLQDVGLLTLYPVVGLLWVCAFVCLALDRVAAARTFAISGAIATLLVTIALMVINGVEGNAFSSTSGSDVRRWGWLVGSLIAVLLCPPGVPARRRLWLGAYAVGTGALVPIALNAFRSVGVGHQYADLARLASTLGIVAMVGALLYWPLARRAPLAWLLALATFAGGIAFARMLTGRAPSFAGATVEEIARSVGSGQVRTPSLTLADFVTSTDGRVVVLAVGSVGAVLVALRGLPGRPPDRR